MTSKYYTLILNQKIEYPLNDDCMARVGWGFFWICRDAYLPIPPFIGLTLSRLDDFNILDSITITNLDYIIDSTIFTFDLPPLYAENMEVAFEKAEKIAGILWERNYDSELAKERIDKRRKNEKL